MQNYYKPRNCQNTLLSKFLTYFKGLGRSLRLIQSRWNFYSVFFYATSQNERVCDLKFKKKFFLGHPNGPYTIDFAAMLWQYSSSSFKIQSPYGYFILAILLVQVLGYPYIIIVIYLEWNKSFCSEFLEPYVKYLKPS